MGIPVRPKTLSGHHWFARVAAGAVVLIGISVLAGWAFDIEILRSVIPGSPAMNPGGTALGLLLAGTSLWILNVPPRRSLRLVARVCGGLVVVIALLRLASYVLDWDGGPDLFLFRERLNLERLRTGYPSRMAPNTALGLLLVGLALTLLSGKSRLEAWAIQALACLTTLTVLPAMIGHAYGAQKLSGVHQLLPMALNTAVALALLSFGLLSARPDRGLVAVLGSSGAGGVMARRLLPAAIVIPVLLGWLRWLAQRQDMLDELTGLSLFVLASIIVFTALIWWNAVSLDHLDLNRGRAERRMGVQYRVTRVLAESPRLAEAVPSLLQAICESMDWRLANMWQVDPRAGVLRCTGLWHDPAIPMVGFPEVCRRTSFTPGRGLPGRVWSGGRSAWIWDVVVDTNFPRAAAAEREGLHGAFGFPIIVGSDVLGVIEAFSGRCESSDEELLRVLEAIGSQLGQFMKRKQVEEEVLQERSLLHSLMDTLPDSIYFKDTESHFLRINRALAERLGLHDPDDAAGKADTDFFSPEHALQAREDERAIIASGQPVVGKEEKETWAGGRIAWVSSTKMALRNQEGRIVGTFGVSRDITAWKSAEEALRHGEERFRSLVEATVAIVWSTPASGEFETEQPGWSAFTGQTFEQLKGWGWLDAVHPDDRPNTARVWSAAVESRSLYQVEHRLRRSDGVYRHMLVRAVPVLAREGGIREWIGVHSEIETEKQAQAAMREAKEAAEAATRAKSEFLANMSHEIRTPLNGIIGMTELALDTELSAEQKEYLGMVRLSADHLLTVINDILDFSKIEAGKLDIEKIAFGLREVLDDTVATLAMRAHKKGLELADDVASDVPDNLVGDPHRLRQVVVNLIGNAIKFTEQGEVVLKVQVSSRTDQAIRLQFAVSDTGIGISLEARQRLFRAFSQADMSTTRKYGGTGLGLAISARLVELMGGEIWLESQENQGSTFYFTAQFELAPERADRQSPAQPIQIHGLTVLVVDDNATNRRILQETLTNWGMRPTVVAGGSEALQALDLARQAGNPFALVLLDAMMPEMDGFTLAERIGQEEGSAPPTLMMLSSANRREDSARCRMLGMSAYLTKPIRQSVLLDAIMTSLGGSGRFTHFESTTTQAAEDGPGQRSLRLLLAEDNLVNQRLAVSLLEKRGHRVTVVGNGREVLSALDGQSYDAVLMDVQMPELDGFATTAEIRAREARTGDHIPIVAMTAHSLKGDRDRCLAAGMDAYVSKPLRSRELFEVLKVVVAGATPLAVTESAPADAFDWTAALNRVEGDAELLKELAGLFLQECPRRIEELRGALDQRDAARLQKAAHTLRGSVSNFGTREATEAALRLETKGKEQDWKAANEAFQTLLGAIDRLKAGLAEIH